MPTCSNPACAPAMPIATTASSSRRSGGVPIKRATPSRRALRLEALRQRVGAAREQAEVGADRDERVAPLDEALCLLLVGRKDAGRLADLLQPFHRVFERRLHLGMAPIADMSERGGEI